MASKIKVDNINKVSDDSNIINKCGTAINVGASGNTVTVTGNDIRSDGYKAADGGVIVSQSGTTITIGASGDTVSLASGASQSGFGRSGSVNWDTSSIKTATFSAVSGNGYFCNTNGGSFTVNLPAGSAGDIVSVADYTNTFQTNSLTVSPNGTDKIGGFNASSTLSTEGQSVTFVFVDSTEGWKNVQDSTSNATGNPYMVATGGTISTSGDYKIHTFTGPGTFCVSKVGAGTPCAPSELEYIVVAGAGGGNSSVAGGGGGAGGFRFASPSLAPATYPAKPRAAPAAITATVTAYPIVVGGGGTAPAGPGSTSTFSTIDSAGGAGGSPSYDGGSGAGRQHRGGCGGTGNTPPVSPPQGSNGGSAPSPLYSAGGGGGAMAAGGPAVAPHNAGLGGYGGNGGGFPNAFGTSGQVSSCVYYFSGGGAGGGASNQPGAAGLGGGALATAAGTTNTGGGGGGNQPANPAGNGGSGIVILRYKYQ